MDSSSITAVGNALWGGSGLGLAVLLQWLIYTRAHVLPTYVVQAMRWGRLPGVCLFLHRLYWNIGIALRPEDGRGYHPAIIDHKHWTLLLTVGMVLGTYMATRSLLGHHFSHKYTMALSLWLAVYMGLTLMLV